MAQDKPVGQQQRHTDAVNLPPHHADSGGRGTDPNAGVHDSPHTSGTRRSRAADARRHAQVRAYLEQVDALSARISAAWTGDGSAVDAVREQRREL